MEGAHDSSGRRKHVYEASMSQVESIKNIYIQWGVVCMPEYQLLGDWGRRIIGSRSAWQFSKNPSTWQALVSKLKNEINRGGDIGQR